MKSTRVKSCVLKYLPYDNKPGNNFGFSNGSAATYGNHLHSSPLSSPPIDRQSSVELDLLRCRNSTFQSLEGTCSFLKSICYERVDLSNAWFLSSWSLGNKICPKVADEINTTFHHVVACNLIKVGVDSNCGILPRARKPCLRLLSVAHTDFRVLRLCAC